MQSGVDDKARGAPQLHGEAAEIRIRIFVKTHFLRNELGVKPPAFHISGGAAELAEARRVFKLLGDGELHMVTRHAFMIGERLHLIDRHVVHVVEIGVVDARSGAARRRALIERLAGRFFAKRFDAFDDDFRFRLFDEQLVEPTGDVFN